ncbi:sigma-70 family RNA polymerase sigma factor [Sphingomonas montana]|uniref:sigma-70 family RNA polymerase sigma factor n=1 Tax=Sphingomonas montana TaxID=1843236 RepID=UPI001F0A6D44|nr:sigma-70 family RNA polymerase sigma factor [Sphingomonas montana]
MCTVTGEKTDATRPEPRLPVVVTDASISRIDAPGMCRSVSGDRWSEMMSAALAGNGGAYSSLLTETAAWLQRYYAHRLPAPYVDDIVQEALIAIHMKRYTYDPARPFKAWMAGIARYKWIDRLRSMNRNRFDLIEGFEASVEDHGSVVTGSLDVQKLLGQLKQAQVDAIRLVKLEGYSIQEASEATGQSIALVKVNIHRGIARLAAAIDSDDDRL